MDFPGTTDDDSRRARLWAACGLAVVLLAAYAPMVLRTFAFNDDLLMWVGPADRPATAHPQFGYFFLIGRPLFPLLAWPVWEWARSMESLSVVRFGMLLLLIGCGWRLQGWLRQVGAPSAVAALLPPILLLLPAVQTQMVLANSLPHPIALGLAVEAARAAHAWAQGGRMRLAAGATAMLMAGLCIYPPTVFVYPALALMALAFQKSARTSIRMLLPLLLAAGIYYFFTKLSYRWLAPILHVPDAIMGGHEVALADEGPMKVGLFWRLLLQAANLWGISFQWPAVLAVLVVLAGGYAAAWSATRPPPETVGVHAGACGLLVVASLLPQLTARLNYYSFRSLTGISWIIATAVVWAWWQVSGRLGRRFGPPALRLALAAILAICGVQCFRNVDLHVVRPAQAEAGWILRRLTAPRRNAPRLLRLRQPRDYNYVWWGQGSFNLLGTGDEYGYLSTGGGPNALGLVHYVLRSRPELDVFEEIHVVPPAAVAGPPANDPAVLEIDMNEVLEQLSAPSGGP